ncbi:hypothetical protein PRZ48_004984 [Zasmidium cellare]|uniref:Uncharacterized protein n=1 Tax=Zasmidium cellare TaxID=395010 RepID=A0ABR0ER55_ZASCE|nr:hypothetical protein PRZ48_004984 [Zasmidium cellare]
MGDWDLRSRPSEVILRNKRLFVGYDDLDRECWFGCLPAEIAEDLEIEEDLDWYRVWFSDTDFVPENHDLKVNPCTVTEEDPSITKLLDQNNMETDILSRLSPDERTLRYANLLHGIAKGKYSYRSHVDSDAVELKKVDFTPRPPPRPRRSVNQNSSHRASTSKTKRKRPKSAEDDDEDTIELSSNVAKKAKPDVDQDIDEADFSDNYSPGHVGPDCFEDDEDDDEGVDISGIQGLQMKDEDHFAETDGMEAMESEESNSPVKGSAEQLMDALEDLYNMPYAAPQRARIDELLRKAEGSVGLGIEGTALRLGRQILPLFGEAVSRARNGAKHQEEFLKFLEHHQLPDELKKASRNLTAELMEYVRVVGKKIEGTEAIVRKLERVPEEEEEEEEL